MFDADMRPAHVAVSKVLFPTLDVGDWDEQSPQPQESWVADVAAAFDAGLRAVALDVERQIRTNIATELLLAKFAARDMNLQIPLDPLKVFDIAIDAVVVEDYRTAALESEHCECGQTLDDGEGWDGKCGSCADRAERGAPDTERLHGVYATWRNIIVDVLQEQSLLQCTRVWEAWSYGTMTEGDFDDAPVEHIAEEILEALIPDPEEEDDES